MKKKIALYPGSFDPITLGHVDVINRMSHVFDKIIVLVSQSPQKEYLFSSDQRKKLVISSLRKVENVEVEVFDGLTVDFARRAGATVILRGLRAVSDFEYEMAMSTMNKQLAPGIETLIAFASPQYSAVSSKMIKEVARFGGDLDGLVPSAVAKAFESVYVNK